jgi:outer membrane protein assembly factor BamB
MPSSPPSRRRFLRTTAAYTTAISAVLAGCNASSRLSGVDVEFRTRVLESPPVGLVKAGIWLVAAGRDGRVVGVDRGDGEVQWESDAVDDLRIPPVGLDDELYVVGEDVVSINGAIEEWRRSLPAVATAATAVPGSEAVAVGTGGDVVVVDAADGERRWRGRLVADGSARVDALATADGVVYAGSRDGAAVAFDAETGVVRWRTDTVVSAVTANGPDAVLGRRRVSSVRDGDVQWRVDTENNWTTEIASAEDWYLSGSRIEGNGYVHAVSSSGEERWRHRLAGDAAALTSVVNGGFAVGVEGERPGVHWFGVDGEEGWFFETETSVVDAYGDDWVWAVTASGALVALTW